MTLKAKYVCEWNKDFNKVEAIKFVRYNLAGKIETTDSCGYSYMASVMSLRDAKYFVDSGEELELEVALVKGAASEAAKYGLKFIRVGKLPQSDNKSLQAVQKRLHRVVSSYLKNAQYDEAMRCVEVIRMIDSIEIV